MMKEILDGRFLGLYLTLETFKIVGAVLGVLIILGLI